MFPSNIYLRPLTCLNLDLGEGTLLYVICTYYSSAGEEETHRFETKMILKRGVVEWFSKEVENLDEKQDNNEEKQEDSESDEIIEDPKKQKMPFISNASMALSSFASYSSSWMNQMDSSPLPSPLLGSSKVTKLGMKSIIDPLENDGCVVVRLQVWTALYGIMDSLIGQGYLNLQVSSLVSTSHSLPIKDLAGLITGTLEVEVDIVDGPREGDIDDWGEDETKSEEEELGILSTPPSKILKQPHPPHSAPHMPFLTPNTKQQHPSRMGRSSSPPFPSTDPVQRVGRGMNREEYYEKNEEESEDEKESESEIEEEPKEVVDDNLVPVGWVVLNVQSYNLPTIPPSPCYLSISIGEKEERSPPVAHRKEVYVGREWRMRVPYYTSEINLQIRDEEGGFVLGSTALPVFTVIQDQTDSASNSSSHQLVTDHIKGDSSDDEEESNTNPNHGNFRILTMEGVRKEGDPPPAVKISYKFEENMDELFWSLTPKRLPPPPEEELSVDKLRIILKRIRGVLALFGWMNEGYRYLMDWRNPLYTLTMLSIFVLTTLYIDAEYALVAPLGLFLFILASLWMKRRSGEFVRVWLGLSDLANGAKLENVDMEEGDSVQRVFRLKIAITGYVVSPPDDGEGKTEEMNMEILSRNVPPIQINYLPEALSSMKPSPSISSSPIYSLDSHLNLSRELVRQRGFSYDIEDEELEEGMDDISSDSTLSDSDDSDNELSYYEDEEMEDFDDEKSQGGESKSGLGSIGGRKKRRRKKTLCYNVGFFGNPSTPETLIHSATSNIASLFSTFSSTFLSSKNSTQDALLQNVTDVWKRKDGVEDISFIYPILQPKSQSKLVDGTESHEMKDSSENFHVIPWEDSVCALQFLVYPKTETSTTSLLSTLSTKAKAVIPISHLSSLIEYHGWFLDSKGGAIRLRLQLIDSTSDGHSKINEDNQIDEVSDTNKFPKQNNKAAYDAMVSLLQSHHDGSKDESSSSLSTIWNLRANVEWVQNLLNGILGKIESFKNIFNWTYPHKTSIIFFSVLFAFVLFFLIPGRWIILVVGIHEFLYCFYPHPEDPMFSILISNLLLSMPNDLQVEEAYRRPREVLEAQQEEKSRDESRKAKLNLFFGSSMWDGVISEVRLVSSNGNRGGWEKGCYLVIQGHRLAWWSSEKAVEDGISPIGQLLLQGHSGVTSPSPVDVKDVGEEMAERLLTVFGKGKDSLPLMMTILAETEEDKQEIEDAVNIICMKKED